MLLLVDSVLGSSSWLAESRLINRFVQINMPPCSLTLQKIGSSERALQIEHSRKCQHLAAYRSTLDARLDAIERRAHRSRQQLCRIANRLSLTLILVSQLGVEAALAVQLVYYPFEIVLDHRGRCPSSVHRVGLRATLNLL